MGSVAVEDRVRYTIDTEVVPVLMAPLILKAANVMLDKPGKVGVVGVVPTSCNTEDAADVTKDACIAMFKDVTPPPVAGRMRLAVKLPL